MTAQGGVKTLAHLLSRAGMDNLLGVYEGASSTSADRDEAKKLDVIAVSFPMLTLHGVEGAPHQCAPCDCACLRADTCRSAKVNKWQADAQTLYLARVTLFNHCHGSSS